MDRMLLEATQLDICSRSFAEEVQKQLDALRLELADARMTARWMYCHILQQHYAVIEDQAEKCAPWLLEQEDVK